MSPRQSSAFRSVSGLVVPWLRAALTLLLPFAATLPLAHGQTDGANNTAYQPPIPRGNVFIILPNADGSAFYGGDFTTIGPKLSILGGSTTASGPALARVNADGSLDGSFMPLVVESNSAVTANVDALAIDSSGNLLVGGQFTSINGVACSNIARLKSNGTVDTSFVATVGSGLSTDIVRVLVAESNGDIVVGGNFAMINGVARSGLALWNSLGQVYTVWNSGAGVPAGETVKALVVQSDGNVVIGGSFDSFDSVARSGLARVTAATGSLDSTFAVSLAPPLDSSPLTVNSIVAQPNGSLIVGGDFDYPYTNPSRASLIRLTSNGLIDSTLYSNINGTVAFSAVQSDGRILIGGDFDSLTDASGASVSLDNAARLFSDGSLDSSFEPQALEFVDAFALLPDGNLLVGEYDEEVAAGHRFYMVPPGFPPAVTNAIIGLVANSTGLAEFANTNYSVSGNAGSLAVQVKRSGTLAGSVNYSSSDGSTSGTLSWAAGDSITKSFNLPITASAASNTVTLILANASGGMTVGGPTSKATVVIAPVATPTPTPSPTSTPAFFTGQTSLGQGIYYLAFPNGNFFGYYSFLTDPAYIFHFDLGYEYVFDAKDGNAGVYLYDFASSDFFYTSPGFPFPYLYDFGLQSTVYYYPDPNDPGHYNTDGVRYFYVFNTGQIISK